MYIDSHITHELSPLFWVAFMHSAVSKLLQTVACPVPVYLTYKEEQLCGFRCWRDWTHILTLSCGDQLLTVLAAAKCTTGLCWWPERQRWLLVTAGFNRCAKEAPLAILPTHRDFRVCLRVLLKGAHFSFTELETTLSRLKLPQLFGGKMLIASRWFSTSKDQGYRIVALDLRPWAATEFTVGSGCQGAGKKDICGWDSQRPLQQAWVSQAGRVERRGTRRCTVLFVMLQPNIWGWTLY